MEVRWEEEGGKGGNLERNDVKDVEGGWRGRKRRKKGGGGWRERGKVDSEKS
jgi:hypothetical protein